MFSADQVSPDGEVAELGTRTFLKTNAPPNPYRAINPAPLPRFEVNSLDRHGECFSFWSRSHVTQNYFASTWGAGHCRKCLRYCAGVDVNSGQYAIGIRGYVPVICRASVGATAAPVNGSDVNLGGLREFCNAPNGYEVYADYSPALSQAALIVDGQKINLSRDGSTRITKSNRAAIANRQIGLDLSKTNNASGNISFRIVAM